MNENTTQSNIINIDDIKRNNEKQQSRSPSHINEPKQPVQFWGEDPNVLFAPKYILEFFPTSQMSFNQQLNAVTRTIIILTIIGFLFSRSIRLLAVFVVTMGGLWFMHRHRVMTTHENFSKMAQPDTENYDNNVHLQQKKENMVGESNYEQSVLTKKVLDANDIQLHNVFDEPTATNPFSNILLTDYEYNPHKKPAPPCFRKNVNETIMTEAKQLIANNHPDQPNIADKLFRDLGEQFSFEQSMHSFHTTPNTTIPNDQNGFAEFCYGGMTSCKEGNLFACAKNLSRFQNM